MRRTAFCLSLLALAACSGEAPPAETNRADIAKAVAAVRIEPGEWEQVTRILSAEAPGLPREIEATMRERTSRFRYCITPQQAADPAEIGRRIAQQRPGCTMQGFAMADGRMRGQMVCDAGTPRAVRADTGGDYGPTRYRYRTTVVTPAPMMGGDVTVTAEVTGQRVAATCPPAP